MDELALSAMAFRESRQSNGEGYDRLYVPIKGHTTGDVDIHDLVVERRPAAEGGDRPVFAYTLFNCLATTSETHSLQPLWNRHSFRH